MTRYLIASALAGIALTASLVTIQGWRDEVAIKRFSAEANYAPALRAEIDRLTINLNAAITTLEKEREQWKEQQSAALVQLISCAHLIREAGLDGKTW